jgi:nitrate/TMAO reductase-like tetraheme cytochrome c subunit
LDERDVDLSRLELAAARRARPTRRRTRRPMGWVLIWVVVGIVVLGAGFVAVAAFTDRPAFCRSCHEMVPYYDAWAVGKHKDVSCIECHVEPGMAARLGHKFVALGEVRSHFTGDTKFPRPTPPDVPASRCTTCHSSIPNTTKSGFNHGEHAKRGTCAGCHPDAGHDVSAAALQSAGIYQPSPASTLAPNAVAAIGAGAANVDGHVPVSCSRCHDLAKTGCKACHTPKHKSRGACLLCHRAGTTFVFVHPAKGVDCAPCHKLPAGHTEKADCLTCHDHPGKTWKYTHQAGQDCSKCHDAPARHRAGACPDCHHKAGVNWTFAHPGSGSDCGSCHKPPAGHYAGTCSRCHHRTGRSFAFSHASAGEHSWRSRPCKKCHPSGGAAVSCTCHGGRPPRD